MKFEYGCSPDLTVEQLKNQGFHYVLIATGTDKNSGVKLAGDNQNVWKSLPFLREYNKGTALKLGKHVVVVGAGNTAMDCARAALRVPGVEKATIVYRRSLQEMPAWREEYEEALHDGVEFRFLNNPERFDADGTLTLRVMSLGEPDEKGRRRPVETNETVTLHVDSLITAIGEQQDTEADLPSARSSNGSTHPPASLCRFRYNDGHRSAVTRPGHSADAARLAHRQSTCSGDRFSAGLKPSDKSLVLQGNQSNDAPASHGCSPQTAAQNLPPSHELHH